MKMIISCSQRLVLISFNSVKRADWLISQIVEMFHNEYLSLSSSSKIVPLWLLNPVTHTLRQVVISTCERVLLQASIKSFFFCPPLSRLNSQSPLTNDTRAEESPQQCLVSTEGQGQQEERARGDSPSHGCHPGRRQAS